MDKKDNKKVNLKKLRKRRKRRSKTSTTTTTTNNTLTIALATTMPGNTLPAPNGAARARYRSNLNNYLRQHHAMVTESRIRPIEIVDDDKDKENDDEEKENEDD